ncbi:unnamed protein product [Rhizophagus irregularis]|nr:unnamed protein product [Rhizophagus irregularis]
MILKYIYTGELDLAKQSVRPYKAIIPHHIYEEVAEFYYKKTLPKTTTLPPRTGKSGSLTSTIIKPKLINIISNWIDRNNSAAHSNNNKYKFSLIYLMSRDGFNSATFYNKCNGQGPFVVLIRVGSKKIYGGYNPIGYTAVGIETLYTGRNQWLSSTESFVFSFENDQDIHNMKMGRAINTDCSVYDHCHYDAVMPQIYMPSIFSYFPDFLNSSCGLLVPPKVVFAGFLGFSGKWKEVGNGSTIDESMEHYLVTCWN